MIFANPWVFLLLLLIPLLLFLKWKKQSQSGLAFSSLSFAKFGHKAPVWKVVLPYLLRGLFWVFVIVALARPQEVKTQTKQLTDAYDIMLVIDSSESMSALDFKKAGRSTDRLDVVKSVVRGFVEQRFSDRIGLVVFGEYAMTQVPLTFDHQYLLKFLENTSIGMVGQSTAIGDAIAVATRRQQIESSKSKIIILLTDGENTAGKLQPLEAAKAAAALGAKIYTVAIGRNGRVPFPAKGFFGNTVQYYDLKVDFETLEKIASLTGAKAFRASDTDQLKDIYAQIDKLEKSKIEKKNLYEFKDKAAGFVQIALFLFILELVYACTSWRRIP